MTTPPSMTAPDRESSATVSAEITIVWESPDACGRLSEMRPA
jgi:hypothetical protein